MGLRDFRPLEDAPISQRIQAVADNRLGAIYSALYGFWSARANAIATIGATRGDAYSVILSGQCPVVVLSGDLTMSPDDMLNSVLAYGPSGRLWPSDPLVAVESVMVQHWNVSRYAVRIDLQPTLIIRRSPVVVFLSSGTYVFTTNAMNSLARRSVALG